jgi:hypothetical protein
VATENIGINVFIGNGSGGFGAVPTIALAGTTFLDVADFNGDGRIDIIAARVGATQTVLINTTAPGTNGAFFQASNIDALIVDFGTVKAVDINFDDRPDLIFSSNDNFVQVVFNTTLVGTFSASFASTTSFDATPQLLLTPGVGPFALAVGDLNNDGFKDLLVGNVTSGTVAVYFNEPSFELLPMLNVAAVVGQDFGGPFVTIFYRDARAPLTFTAFPFVSPFGVYTGGVRVAIGDVTGDGVMDIITGAGPGGGPRIQVFDGFDLSERASFFALSYDARLGGILNLGVYIAFGVIGGEPAIIVGAGEGAGFGPRVQVVRAFGVLDRGFDPNFSIPETPETVFASFFAYQQFAGGIQFTSGVRVAAGDVDGDGDWDVITGPGPDGGPLLKIFTNVNGLFGEPFPTQQSFVFPPETTALGLGLYVSFASFNGVPTVVAGVGGRPGQPGFGANISAFSTVNLPEVPTVANLSASFFLDYPPSQLTTGVRVGTGDFNGDGVPDLLAGAGSPFPDLFPIDGLLVRAVGIKPLTDGPGSVLVNSTITRDNDLALLGGTALDTELLGIFVG